MKHIFYVLILATLIQCKPNIKVEKTLTSEQETENITKILDQWHLDAAETNFDAYFNAMSPNGIFIGTDPGENWTIPEFKEFCKPYFDQGSAWDFTAVERNIYFNNKKQIAWFDELLDTWMGICRGSGVLEKQEDGWKINHYVLSITIPNDNINDIQAMNKEKDSLYLERLKRYN